MSAGAWILSHAISVLFWLWIIFWGGAERLEGTFSSGFLVDLRAPHWDAEGIKLFAWLVLIGGSIWFIVGLIWPLARFHW